MDVYDRTRRRRQPAVPGHMVGVVVRLEDVADGESVLLGEAEVVGDVPFRVDDRRLAAARDHVGRAAEIVVEDLPEEHAAMVSGRRGSDDFEPRDRFDIFLGNA